MPTSVGAGSRPGPNLEAALRGLVGEAREYARLRGRASVRASLQRVVDEAAVTLPAATRQQVAGAVGAPDDRQTPLFTWTALLAECRKAVEDDIVSRTGRLREIAARAGFLIDPALIGRILGALDEDPEAIQDLGALLDRRRAMSLLEAEADRRETEIRRRWEASREEVASRLGGGAAEAAEGALRTGDLLPLADALDQLAAGKSRAAGEQDRLGAERAALDAAIASAREVLAPEEVAWAGALVARAPRRVDGEEARTAWSAALREIAGCLQEIVAARREAIAILEEALGEQAGGPPATAYRRLVLLIEALRERRAAAEGRLEAARRTCAEAEWDLSRAVWEEGALASAASMIEARRCFLDCHRAKEATDEEALGRVAERTAFVAARVRLEAAWGRRFLERHGAGVVAPPRGPAPRRMTT